MSDELKYRIAWRRLSDGAEFRGAPIGYHHTVKGACDDLNRRHAGVHYHWPEPVDAAPPCLHETGDPRGPDSICGVPSVTATDALGPRCAAHAGEGDDDA